MKQMASKVLKQIDQEALEREKVVKKRLAVAQAKQAVPPGMKFSRYALLAMPNIQTYLGGNMTVTGNKVTIRINDMGEFKAVLSYTDVETLMPKVAFGDGDTWTGALLNLNKAVAAGRVYDSKPYEPKK